jgi:hypothetical protein
MQMNKDILFLLKFAMHACIHFRDFNCSNVFGRFSYILASLTVLQSSVLALDDTALDVDQVDNLIKFCPTKEEMELLKVLQILLLLFYLFCS